MHCTGDVSYVGASFSTSGDNFLIEILGPDIPQFFLRSTVEGKEYKCESLNNFDVKVIDNWLLTLIIIFVIR